MWGQSQVQKPTDNLCSPCFLGYERAISEVNTLIKVLAKECFYQAAFSLQFRHKVQEVPILSYSHFSLLDTLLNCMLLNNCSTVASTNIQSSLLTFSISTRTSLRFSRFGLIFHNRTALEGLTQSSLSGWLQCEAAPNPCSCGRCLKQTNLLLGTVWDCCVLGVCAVAVS